jgi:hypothetical protein
MVNSVEVYTVLLYYAMEMTNSFSNLSLAHPSMYTIMFVLVDILRMVVPPLIITHEVLAVIRIVGGSGSSRAHREGGASAGEKEGGEELPHTRNELNWATYLNMRHRQARHLPT